MGAALLPALRVRNMIERMVRSGALTGDKAAAWQLQLAQQDEVRGVRETAARGGRDGNGGKSATNMHRRVSSKISRRLPSGIRDALMLRMHMPRHVWVFLI